MVVGAACAADATPGKCIKETLPSWNSLVMANCPSYRDGAPVAVPIVAIRLKGECKNRQRLVVGEPPSARRRGPTLRKGRRRLEKAAASGLNRGSFMIRD